MGVHNRCKTINMEALKQATALVSKYWPKAVDRYSQQGLKIVFSNDSQTYAGPQWLIEGLGFTRGSDSISVQYSFDHDCQIVDLSRCSLLQIIVAIQGCG